MPFAGLSPAAHERLGPGRLQADLRRVPRPLPGRTLDENLTALGMSGQQFLEQVLFYDGSALAICQDRPRPVSSTPPPSAAAGWCECARPNSQALQRKTPVGATSS